MHINIQWDKMLKCKLISLVPPSSFSLSFPVSIPFSLLPQTETASLFSCFWCLKLTLSSHLLNFFFLYENRLNLYTQYSGKKIISTSCWSHVRRIQALTLISISVIFILTIHQTTVWISYNCFLYPFCADGIIHYKHH